METRKIVLKVEIDARNFDLAKESLWELIFKIEDWCSSKEYIRKCRIAKFEEKNKR